jgi:hypothetical protein
MNWSNIDTGSNAVFKRVADEVQKEHAKNNPDTPMDINRDELAAQLKDVTSTMLKQHMEKTGEACLDGALC